MSGDRRNTAVVVREYRTAPDSCVHALGLLLKSSVNKKAAERPTPDGRDEAKEWKHG
jgi:hypothetical protein